MFNVSYYKSEKKYVVEINLVLGLPWSSISWNHRQVTSEANNQ